MSNDVFQTKFSDRLTKNFIRQMSGAKETRDERRFFKTNIQCSLCDTQITDARDSHNAFPLSDFRCCSNCNESKVLPARFMAIFKRPTVEEETSEK